MFYNPETIRAHALGRTEHHKRLRSFRKRPIHAVETLVHEVGNNP